MSVVVKSLKHAGIGIRLRHSFLLFLRSRLNVNSLGIDLVLHSQQHVASGEGDRANQIAKQALELLPPAALHIWSYAIGARVLADQMGGDIGRGLEIVNEILNENCLLPGMTEARMMLWLCLAYWMEGDLNGLKQPAARCRNRSVLVDTFSESFTMCATSCPKQHVIWHQ